MEWKKEQEWLIISYFRQRFPPFPSGTVEKAEAPDFIIHTQKKRYIGIELTRVTDESAENRDQAVLRQDDPLSQIRGSLHFKEEKAPRYRSRGMESLWLIIFADYSESRAMDRLHKSLINCQLQSNFDHIYFFDLDSGKIATVK